jgi:hypothetical protein
VPPVVPSPVVPSPVVPALVVSPCRRLCDWAAVNGPLPRGSGQRFACAGCGSEWASGQGWTPRQADGSVPHGVAEQLRRSAGAAGSAGS